MNFQVAQRYHEKLIETFNNVPRQRKDLPLWTKAAVIARINKAFQHFLVDELARQQETTGTSELPLPSEVDAPEPPVEIPSVPEEVFIPEWKPELEQPENTESDYD